MASAATGGSAPSPARLMKSIPGPSTRPNNTRGPPAARIGSGVGRWRHRAGGRGQAPRAPSDAPHVAPLEPSAEGGADPADGERRDRRRRAEHRSIDEVDPGPEHETQQYEGAAGGEDRVEGGQVAPPDGRQP